MADSRPLQTLRRKLGKEWNYYTKSSRNASFYSTESLRDWVAQYADGLVQDVDEFALLPSSGPPDPIFSHPHDGPTYVLTFCALLEQQEERLIRLFQKAGIDDGSLESDQRRDELRSILERKSREVELGDINEIIDRFESEKWKFLVPEFEYQMERRFADRILPFFRQQDLKPGATSSVSWVLVPEEFVGPEMRRQLPNSRCEIRNRTFYELAIKTYRQSNRRSYDRELEAFKALQRAPGIIRWLGCYETLTSAYGVRFHIVMEYSRMDMVRFFEYRRRPQLSNEIYEHWEYMLQIAEAISDIHSQDFYDETNQMRKYNGWHGDIKPANILHTPAGWKLADFGFAKFKPDAGDGARPRATLAGATVTYGAPETAHIPVKDDTSSAIERWETEQTCDVWSFGCVLSVTATWLICGPKGIEVFSALRRFPESRSDAFHHDGKVLPEIEEWHQYLESICCKTDNLTRKILALISRGMLTASSERYTSKHIVEEFREILNLTKPTEADPNQILAKIKTIVRENESAAFDDSDAIEMLREVTDLKETPEFVPSAAVQKALKEYDQKALKKFDEDALRIFDETHLTRVTAPLNSTSIPLHHRTTSYGSSAARKGSLNESKGQSSLDGENGIDDGTHNVPRAGRPSHRRSSNHRHVIHQSPSSSSPAAPQAPSEGSSSGGRRATTQDSRRRATLESENAIEDDSTEQSSSNANNTGSIQHNRLGTGSSSDLDLIFVAIEGPHQVFLDRILKQNPDIDSVKNQDGLTPIMFAVEKRKWEYVEMLLPHWKMPRTDYRGQTLLHHVVRNIRNPTDPKDLDDSVEALEAILTHLKTMCRLDILNHLNVEERTALIECIAPWGPRPNYNHKSDLKRWDVENKLLEAARLLLDAGSTPLPGDGKNAFSVVQSEHNDPRMADLLREKYPIEASMYDQSPVGRRQAGKSGKAKGRKDPVQSIVSGQRKNSGFFAKLKGKMEEPASSAKGI